MKKKRNIVMGLMLAFYLFANVSANIDMFSHSTSATNSFITSDKGPIGGNH